MVEHCICLRNIHRLNLLSRLHVGSKGPPQKEIEHSGYSKGRQLDRVENMSEDSTRFYEYNHSNSPAVTGSNTSTKRDGDPIIKDSVPGCSNVVRNAVAKVKLAVARVIHTMVSGVAGFLQPHVFGAAFAEHNDAARAASADLRALPLV